MNLTDINWGEALAFAIIGMITVSRRKNRAAFALSLLAIGLWTLDFGQSKAFAGLQSQTDTNSLAVNSTNTFILSGDVTGSFTNGETPSAAYVVCKNGDDAFVSVGGFFTNTTAGASNITFRIAQTVDFVNWTNSAATVTLVVPASSTNWAVGHTLIQNAFPGYGLRAIENANTGGVTARAGSMYFKVYVKDGI
jgi:hypothetical protein